MAYYKDAVCETIISEEFAYKEMTVIVSGVLKGWGTAIVECGSAGSAPEFEVDDISEIETSRLRLIFKKNDVVISETDFDKDTSGFADDIYDTLEERLRECLFSSPEWEVYE